MDSVFCSYQLQHNVFKIHPRCPWVAFHSACAYCSAADGTLELLLVWASVNKAAKNILAQACGGGVYIGTELLNQKTDARSALQETGFSSVAGSLSTSTSPAGDLSTHVPTLSIAQSVNLETGAHSTVVPRCGLICVPLMTNAVDCFFKCSLALCLSSVAVYLNLPLSFFNWIFCLCDIEL